MKIIWGWLSSRVVFGFLTAMIFRIKFRSLNRNVPSVLCHMSRSGSQGILYLRQYLIAYSITYWSLDLSINTVHHLIHFSWHPRVKLTRQSIDLSIRVSTCWILSEVGLITWYHFCMIQVQVFFIVVKHITSSTFWPSSWNTIGTFISQSVFRLTLYLGFLYLRVTLVLLTFLLFFCFLVVGIKKIREQILEFSLFGKSTVNCFGGIFISACKYNKCPSQERYWYIYPWEGDTHIPHIFQSRTKSHDTWQSWP